MMKKKKRRKKNINEGFSNSKIHNLIISAFRENPNKQLNYKKLSKILNIKEMGIKIQLVDVMKEMDDKIEAVRVETEASMEAKIRLMMQEMMRYPGNDN